MAIDDRDASGALVFEARDVTHGYGGAAVIRNWSARILRGDRIGLIGPNGSGKTTLLRLLADGLQPDSGEIRRGARLQVAYFDQQRSQLDPDRTVAESVTDGDTVIVNGRPKHVVGYLGDFLFPPERAQSPVAALSGGERNRLLLARLFARPANVLVFDEPTNDLDIETLELLEDLIGEFDGTVLLVTHDRVFLDNIITSALAFEGDGRVVEYVGGWQDYLRQAGPGSAQPTGSAEPRPARVRQEPAESADRARRRTFKEQREFEAMPRRIEGLEEEQQRLQREVAGPEFYRRPAQEIHDVLARIETIQAELDAALSRWVELETIGS
jgi:ATP-binding cassette subfamily F protein uup